MKPTILILLSVAALTGCVEVVPAYSPVASHTLKITPDQEADVVWVQRYDAAGNRVNLYRCHNSPQGPQCISAKAP